MMYMISRQQTGIAEDITDASSLSPNIFSKRNAEQERENNYMKTMHKGRRYMGNLYLLLSFAVKIK